MLRQFLFIFLVVLLGSCRSLKPPVFNRDENVQMNKFSFGQSTLTLDLSFFNPNHTRATLKQAEGDAWMDSTFLGHFIVDTSILIPSNSEFLIPVKLQVDMKYLLQHSLSAFENEEVNIQVKGTARLGKAGVFKRYPLNYSGMQNLAKLFQQKSPFPGNEPN